MAPAQQIRQEYAKTGNIEQAVKAIIPDADAKVIRYWDRVINNPTPCKQQPKTRKEAGFSSTNVNYAEKVLVYRNAFDK